ncbi:hypothetical protein HMPREF3227_02243 [Corynebacterium sp. CMW7794]|nr:hypothetical protein HMPREF0307_01260 [Corynebacterium sp. DNF00584]KXI15941.1 hypothetical protein HMPREF3227_02243 [Corynebacterium sp. CMW7794]
MSFSCVCSCRLAPCSFRLKSRELLLAGRWTWKRFVYRRPSYPRIVWPWYSRIVGC